MVRWDCAVGGLVVHSEHPQDKRCDLPQVAEACRVLRSRARRNAQGRIPGMPRSYVFDVAVIARDEQKCPGAQLGEHSLEECVDELERRDGAGHRLLMACAVGRIVGVQGEIVLATDRGEICTRLLGRDLRQLVVTEVRSPPVVHDLARDRASLAQRLLVAVA